MGKINSSIGGVNMQKTMKRPAGDNTMLAATFDTKGIIISRSMFAYWLVCLDRRRRY